MVLIADLLRVANVDVVDAALMRNAVIGPLTEYAEVVGDFSGGEDTGLLNDGGAVLGKFIERGMIDVAGGRARHLQHPR